MHLPELHGKPRERPAHIAGFANVLHAIGVIVQPDAVAQAGQIVDAHIPTQVAGAGGETDQASAERERVRVHIAVGGTVGKDTVPWANGRVARRQVKHQIVVTRRQIPEAVETATQGRRAAD